ncbi:MAG TPA: MBL fold metallo-hydrolase [Povalibacter sp.]
MKSTRIWLSALLVCLIARVADAKTLDIYFIDVEGGQATLLITPRGESLLIDTGFAGDGNLPPGPTALHEARDANRILAVARAAGLKQIDYLLITHFHPDHDGGAPELSRLLPIRTFIDHGDVAPEERESATTMSAFDAYTAVRKAGRHIEPKPGQRLPLQGVEVVVVSSAAEIISKPLTSGGTRNAACEPSARPEAPTGENPRSTGVVVNFGKFRFLDIGDLSGRPLFDLACPDNLVGAVDVYLVAHHGGADVAVPATFAAFNPRVAVMNNGAAKGGARETFDLLHTIPHMDVWQLHWSNSAIGQNFAAEKIANPDESTAHWIKLSAAEDGSFRVLNSRTNTWVSYPAR